MHETADRIARQEASPVPLKSLARPECRECGSAGAGVIRGRHMKMRRGIGKNSRLAARLRRGFHSERPARAGRR